MYVCALFVGVIGGWWYMPSGRIHSVLFWTPKCDAERNTPTILQSTAGAERFLKRILNCTSLDASMASAVQNLEHRPAAGVNIFSLSSYHHTSGKVVMIGDAAHAMSSALGQVQELIVLVE